MTVPQLTEQGYTNIKLIAGKCYAIYRFIFTTGLVVGIDEIGYESRYCYQNHADAVKALEEWDGVGDPPGNWIKQKGVGGDRSNPNYEDESINASKVTLDYQPNNTGIHLPFQKNYTRKAWKTLFIT